MGRRYPYLWRQHSYIRVEERDDPGCIWGLLGLLKYHQHWKNVKQMLPYKKHGSNRRSNSSRGKRKGSSRLKGVHEEEKVADEANPVPVEWVNPPETGSISRRSFKARIREFMAKEDNSKRSISGLPEQSEVKTTPNHGGKIDSSCKDKSVEDVDILEIFNVDRQMFLKMLNDHDLHNKVRLTKSGSFPSVNSTRMREWGPTKLEDKQREIWPLLKGKDLDPSTKSMPLLHGDDSHVVTTSKGKLRSMKRASSLNESMDWYSQLFGSTSSFNKDIKRHHSRSLKMVSNENNDDPTPKFTRRLSLPDCDYDSFIPNMEASKKADSADLDNTKRSSCVSADEPCEEDVIMNKAINEDISQLDERDDVEWAIDCDAQDNQGLVLISEDNEAAPVSQRTSSIEKAGNPETHQSDQILATKLVAEKHNQQFKYVKLALDLSGFTSKEQAWVWYTIEQPISPTLFEEIEKQYYPSEQLKCSTKMEEEEESKWGRKLIFDLNNEALVEIDERSYLYCPRALSFSCRVLPIPKGQWLLEEVWVFVGGWLSWRPELDPTLDFALAQDLHGRNGWMNLQIESECVALELEDMILDELILDQVLLACSSKSIRSQA